MDRAHLVRSDLEGLAGTLTSRLDDPTASARAIDLVAERAADERLALAFLLQLAEHSRDSLVRALRDSGVGADLVFCLGASEFIAADLGAAGEGWLDVFARARAATADSIRAHASAARQVEAGSRQDAAEALFAYKRRRFLEIAIADLLRRVDVAETALLMSELADDCIAIALAMARSLAAPREDASSLKFCVLALGKLGARELNLSSDIDLIYLYDAPDPQAVAVSARRIAEALTEILSGGAFRVDMRLRPGGRNSPLAIPIEAALNFYQSFGETWERAALLRARTTAGDLDLGERMLGELQNFIYRRFLDFDTLRELRALKRQIEAELRSSAMVERNIKLGRGGIRELEFVVQALTLIYGGRDPRLRTENTMTALGRLEAFGYLPAQRAHDLAEAYLFLRDVEHKLQVVAGRQTHTLPADPAAMRALGVRLGFEKSVAGESGFIERLGRCRALVAAQFRETLASGDEDAPPRVPPQAEAAFAAALEPERAAPILAQIGFAAPQESARHLESLAKGPEHLSESARRRELLDRLGPILLHEMSELPDPGLAIMNLAAFINAVGARTSFLALLEQHPATRRVLLRLFASSRYLSTVFIRHPDMLDTLVRSDLARPHRAPEDLAEELGGLIAASRDLESKLDALRTFRHQEFLRIAIADLAGDLELSGVQAELTSLAETVLAAALEVARADVSERHPIPPSIKLATLAMGRLGAREMTYNSDLDLIFVHEDSGLENADDRMAASRIAQKLIATLESRTREGYAYKLDLRLRPSGNHGPLVTSLAGFRDYHRQSSATWERQALVQSRVVAGDAELGQEIEAARREFVFGHPLSAAQVAEIAAMRARMEREIGAENKHRLNLKQGRGGLVDVEFLVQMMALRHGSELAALQVRGTRPLLAALADAGLITIQDSAALAEDFDFLTRLENRLRIESDQPAWALPTDAAALLPLARRMGYADANGPRRMLAELKRRRERIRAIFERYFAAEQAA